MAGKVVLVGAGPGDPGLFTARGARELQKAEVVVFDRLVGREILDMIPPAAEKIDVGKASSNHKVPQEEINRILLDRALAGKYVVRLKGGDPFVFGRGGEELELLSENGVEFAVVPGVTSAVAAAAYAGIPVTHRDFCSSVHIITGHARAGKPLTIDFEALCRTGGTLVFLMGVSALPQITAGLLAAGMAPDTPAAMVESGTTPRQRRCCAPLSELPEKAARMGIHSPAVIIVGRVCGLSDEFCWFEKRPLFGRGILVTRPRGRAGTLSEKLREKGADVIEYPCIEIVPETPCPGLERALENIAAYDWVCLTSPAGAECLYAALRRLGRDARALGGVRLAVIGPGTARELARYGLCADLMPEVYDAQHLGAAISRAGGGRVLIPRAEIGSAALTDELRRGNMEYDDIAVYRTVCENPRSAELRELMAAGGLDYVTFTSASTVRGFVTSLGAGADFSRITGLCIGRQTAAECGKYGIPHVIAREATVDALVELACENI